MYCHLIYDKKLIVLQKAMLTEEQEWSQRFASHLDNDDDEAEDERLELNQTLEELGPEYKVKFEYTLPFSYYFSAIRFH